MLEQKGQAVRFYAQFIASKVGKTGLTPTVDVAYVGAAGFSLAVSGGNAVEVSTIAGLYHYSLAGATTPAQGEYVANFKTTDATVDQQHIPSLWVVGTPAIERLDVAIATVESRVTAVPSSVWGSHVSFYSDTSRLGGYVGGGGNSNADGSLLYLIRGDAEPSLSNLQDDIATNLVAINAAPSSVWATLQVGYTTAGQFGYYVNAVSNSILQKPATSSVSAVINYAAVASNVLDAAQSSYTTSGTIGYYLNTQLSTLATQATADLIKTQTDLITSDPALETTLTNMKYTASGSYDRETDSLEALRDKINTISPVGATTTPQVTQHKTGVTINKVGNE